MNFCTQLLISELIPIWFHVTFMLARFLFHDMSVTISLTKSIHYRQNLFVFLGMHC
jgi:hypothetical protein